MTIFESNAIINEPAPKVYTFLADMNNHKLLMPEEVENWSSTYNTADFNIKNISKISLEVQGRTENLEILIAATQKPPFNLQLKWNLVADGTNTDIILTITADLNMMMRILASKSLQKLADTEIQNLLNAFKKN